MEDFEDDVLTQLTQPIDDPRRFGENHSGLCDEDISDIICILHPATTAACRLVKETAQSRPQHVLQSRLEIAKENLDETESMLNDEKTFILPGRDPADHNALDLAFRFSSRTVNPHLGFTFGRNPRMADIAITADSNRRVSNVHFAIYFNDTGVLMIKDLSTNGTMVDDTLLKGKNNNYPHSRMLLSGSVIQVLTPEHDEVVKFVVRFPTRDGHQDAFDRKFQMYMKRQMEATKLWQRQRARTQVVEKGGDGDFDQQTAVKAPRTSNKFGMHWNGGDVYNVVGQIGKGAFAIVYQLATKREGNLFAAKELEKRKFMKNGVLDRKLDNEMQIMRSINHPSIVQYRDYQDVGDHLYIIMEYVPCGDLQQFLAEQGPLHESIATQVATQTLDALDYLHKKNITHRDIKPDNILLSRVQPNNFVIKLSDFGLSKAVTHNDTFLKTFCGTLLYCAPEVFPHYQPDMVGHGTKRPRFTDPRALKKFRSYSHAVDIWSFGAVLWFSLCLKPPFEGIADANGRAMFERIMMTPLDPSDLAKQGVSDAAVALLVQMLNTNPLKRPSAEECLADQWLSGEKSPSVLRTQTQSELEDIEEEEDVIEGAQEPDVASLTLNDPTSEELRQPRKGMSHFDEVSFNSNDADFFDPRKSKRFKANDMDDRVDGEPVGSSPEVDGPSEFIPIMHENSEVPRDSTSAKPRKLFGEISQSDLEVAIGDALPWTANETAAQPILALRDEGYVTLGRDSQQPGMTESGALASNSSNEVMEMVPDQRGEIPNDAVKALHDSAFTRRIKIGIPTSFFIEANDPRTQNEHAATTQGGHDIALTSDQWKVAATRSNGSSGRSAGAESHFRTPSETSQVAAKSDGERVLKGGPVVPNIDILTQSTAFPNTQNGPRFGRLVSTPESFAQITIDLNDRMTSFGRRSRNTYTYEDQTETRISKDCLTVFFHATGIENVPLGTEDFDTLPGSYCGILTGSSNGIRINKTRLSSVNSGQHTFGKIYTGDVIEVWPHSKHQKGLEFVVQLYQGGTKMQRAGEKQKFKVETGLVRALKAQRPATAANTDAAKPGAMLPPAPKQQSTK